MSCFHIRTLGLVYIYPDLIYLREMERSDAIEKECDILYQIRNYIYTYDTVIPMIRPSFLLGFGPLVLYINTVTVSDFSFFPSLPVYDLSITRLSCRLVDPVV